MIKFSKFISLIALMLLLTQVLNVIHPINATTTTYSLSLTDDSWVEIKYPDNNHGSDKKIHVKGWSAEIRRGYHKFNLSGLPSDIVITSAKLYLYLKSGDDTNHSIAAYEVSDSWAEETITWNNAPSLGSIVDTISVDGKDQWYMWDITSYAQSQYTGDKMLSSVIAFPEDATSTDTTRHKDFTSNEEDKDTWMRPYLEITCTGTAVHFVVTGIPSPMTAGTTSDVTVEALDASDNRFVDYTGTVHFTSSDPTAVLPSDYTFTTGSGGDNGVHTFAGTGFTLKTAGTQTITVTDGTVSETTSITVDPAALDHFDFHPISSPQTAGTSFSITITAKDQYGNTVTSYTGTNTLSDTTGTISPTSTGAFTSGLWTGSITIATDQAGVTITTNGDGKSGTSNSLTMNPSSLASFSITGYPLSITAGQDFGSNNIVVTAYDAYGNIKTDYAGQVYFASSDSQAVLPYTSGSKYQFVLGDGGAHTFAGTDFTLKTAGSRTITVIDGTTSATSSSITVNAASAHKLIITVYPPSVIAGSWTSKYTVLRQDQYGNPLASGSTTVNLASTSDGANKKFSETVGGSAVTSITIPGGSSTKDFYYYDEKAGTLTISIPSIDPTGDSKSLAVNPAALDHIVISPDSPTVPAVGTQPFISVGYDAYGNQISGLSFAWSTTIPGGSISSDGLLTLGGPEGNFPDSVTASSEGVNASVDIIVIPSSSDKLKITSGPNSTTAGSWATFTVQFQDQFGNPVNAGPGGIKVDLSAAPPGQNSKFSDTLGGSAVTSVTIPEGSNSVDFFYYEEKAITSTIYVTSTGIAGYIKDLSVNAGDLDHVVISPKSDTIIYESTEVYALEAYDQFNNLIANVSTDPGTTYSISPGAGGSWSANAYTSENVGTWTVTGTYSSKSDIATLNVNGPIGPPSFSSPCLGSHTHPCQETVYANNDPTFQWYVVGSGIVGYSYVLDSDPFTVPDTSTSNETETSYKDISDGTWYFHVRALDNAGIWGATSHYKVMIDATTGVGCEETKIEKIPGAQVDYQVDASAEANTQITLTTMEEGTIIIIKYKNNPHPVQMPSQTIPRYLDISVTSCPCLISWPIFVKITYETAEVAGLDESNLGIYYWKNGDWRRCSNTGVRMDYNYVWAYMTYEEVSGSPVMPGGEPTPASGEQGGEQGEEQVVPFGDAYRLLPISLGLLLIFLKRRKLARLKHA